MSLRQRASPALIANMNISAKALEEYNNSRSLTHNYLIGRILTAHLTLVRAQELIQIIIMNLFYEFFLALTYIYTIVSSIIYLSRS